VIAERELFEKRLKSRERFADGLAIAARGIGLSASAPLFAFCGTYGERYAALAFLFALPYILMAALRKKRLDYVVYRAICGAATVAAFGITLAFTRNVPFLIVIGLFLMWVCGDALYRGRSGHADEFITVGSLAACGILMMLAWLLLSVAMQQNVDAWMIMAMGLMVAAYFICGHIRSVNRAITWAARTTTRQGKHILKINTLLGSVFISSVIAAVLLAFLLRADILIAYILQGLVLLIYAIYYVFAWFMSVVFSWDLFDTEIQSPAAPQIDLLEYFSRGARPGGVPPVEIVTWLMLFGLVAFILYRLYGAYRKYGNLKDIPETEKQHLSYLMDESANIQKKSGWRRMMGVGLHPSLRMKVRRLFGERVAWYHDKKAVEVRASETAGQLSGKLAAFEEMADVQALYDKARYGAADITQDEWTAVQTKRKPRRFNRNKSVEKIRRWDDDCQT